MISRSSLSLSESAFLVRWLAARDESRLASPAIGIADAPRVASNTPTDDATVHSPEGSGGADVGESVDLAFDRLERGHG